MATTTKILATANWYGSTGSSSANSYVYSGRVYAGKSDEGSLYRSRLTFPSIRSNAAIGDTNIVITKVTLHLRRDGGGPCTVTAGSSADSAWGATTDGSGTTTIAAQTAWYTIDITDCAQAILNYSGNWYMHLTGSGTRVRCNAIDDLDGAAIPYINITWEYAASTITTGTDSTELGTTANFTITPEEDYYSYDLSYEFGSQSGTITTGTTATNYSWMPPLDFASEIPNSSSGEAKVTMHVFNSEGTQIRTEVLFVTLTVPESLKVEIIPSTYTYNVNGSPSDIFLAGKTSLGITPTLNTNNSYGATIKSFTAEINNEDTTQTLTWNTFTLDESTSYYISNSQVTNIFQNAGSVTITFTAIDSRGFDNIITKTYTVHQYNNPTISTFKIERYEAVYNEETSEASEYVSSDVGENVWVTLQAECTPITVDNTSRNFLSWIITTENSDGTTATYSGGGDSTSINYNNDRTLINVTIPTSIAVNYTLQVSDSMNYSEYQYSSVALGRANFALAGSKYGASFGCLPKGTEENPMLESAYPFFAYAGIHGVTNYSIDEVKTGGTWVDGKPIYRKTIYVDYTGTAGATVATLPEAEVIIDIAGYLFDNYANRSSCYPQTFYWTSNNYISMYVAEGGSVNIKATRNLSGYLTVYYTKITDSGDDSVTPVTYPTVALTSANSNGYVVKASSEYSSTYAAWKAFNQSYSDAQGWASSASDSAPWIYIELPKAIRIRSIKIVNRTFSSGVNGVINANVKVTNDTTSAWTQLGTISGRDGATSGLVTIHEFSSGDIAYKYVGIDPTSWNKEAGNYVTIGEIYITGIE